MTADDKKSAYTLSTKGRNVAVVVLTILVGVFIFLNHEQQEQEHQVRTMHEKTVCLPPHNLEELLSKEEGTFGSRYREQWAAIAAEVQSNEDDAPLMKRGAEVGVFKGDFAKEMLSAVGSIEEYILVDPWRHLDDWNKPFNKGDDEFEKIFQEAMSVTRDNPDYGHKVTVIRKPGLDGAKDIANNSLDFVYIDGDHTAKGCLKDLLAWVPKVKCGGFVLGDDYLDSFQHGENFDPTMVKSIVDGYAEAIGAKVYDMGANNWAFVKPRSEDILSC